MPKGELTEDERDLGFVLMQCKKNFPDLMTSMVSEEVCFNDENQTFIYKFQFMVNKIFMQNITNYINYVNKKYNAKLTDTDIVFLYKGGTTMKIIYNKYKNLLEGNNLGHFFTSLADDFKRSDSDYSILINPSIKEETHNISFEKIYYDINIISYHCLFEIRKFFKAFPNFFVPFNLINDNVILKKIDDFNNKLYKVVKKNKDCTNVKNIKKFIGISYFGKEVFLPGYGLDLLDKSNVDFSFRDYLKDTDNKLYNKFIKDKKLDTKTSDFIMSLTDSKEKYYKKINNDDLNEIFLSVNESNEYENNGIFAHFTLQRLKINFVAYYITYDDKIGFLEVPSELVDVSILKKTASGLPLFFKHISHEHQDYNIDNPVLSFNYDSYTIFGHINDLVFTLFDVSKYPWEDAKYIKRLRRILLFVVLELLLNIKDENLCKQVLVYIKSLFLLGSKYSENIEDFNKMNKLIYNTLEKLNLDLASLSLFEKINRLADSNYIKGKEKQLSEMFKNLLPLTDLLDPKEIVVNTKLSEDSIISVLGGNKYYSKYLKYKSKYLKLKSGSMSK